MEGDSDFVERNDAFLLTVLTLLGTCAAGVSIYFLKSRCTRISCLCGSCERDVVPAELAMTDA